MRVLHISTYDSGGAGLCCLRIHQSLLNAGLESKMVVLYKTQHSKEEYQYGHLSPKIVVDFQKIFRKIGWNISLGNRVKALAEKNKTAYTLPISNIDLTKCNWIEWADIIHLHWVNNYLDYPSFFRIVKKPIIWTLHDENLFYGIAHHHHSRLIGHPLEIKFRNLKYESVRSAKNLTIVFLSQMMFHSFESERIIEGRNKVVINNSVNTDIFVPHDRKTVQCKYGIDENKVWFVFISMNIADPNKGLDVLSEVLLKIDSNAKILAIGGNPWQKKWENVYSVGLINNEQELCEYISCANYMAMPSYQEAFSQVPLEAMACGIPVVAFPVSGTEELINSKNGIICDGFTSEALKNGIESLIRHHYDPVAIRQSVKEFFSPKVIINKYINLYDYLINSA